MTKKKKQSQHATVAIDDDKKDIVEMKIDTSEQGRREYIQKINKKHIKINKKKEERKKNKCDNQH